MSNSQLQGLPAPTAEQVAILDAASHRSGPSLQIIAGAGTGKTTTLKMLGRALPLGVPVLDLAFNRSAAQTLEKVMPPNHMVKTLNSLGHGAWSKATGKRLILDERKLGKIISETLRKHSPNAPQEAWQDLKSIVTEAMKQGLKPEGYGQPGLVEDTLSNWKNLADDAGVDSPTEEHLLLSRLILKESIKLSYQGTISYDDQIYMSALFGGVFPKFPVVMTDESQDLSPLNHIMVGKSLGPDGRLITVGDPKQSIYAFRGADSNSMANMRSLRTEWQILPLMLTFRCPKIVVARQQAHVPGYRAHESNPEGQFHSWPHPPATKGDEIEWNWPMLSSLLADLPGRPSVAILCRNNAPILSLAFKLIRRGIGVQVLGRDIGKGLVALSKKLASDDLTPIDIVAGNVQTWANTEIAVARAADKEEKVESIMDKSECLLNVISSSGVKDAGALRAALDNLFSHTDGLVTLSSIHKAKGLEWDVVMELDPHRCPSPWAIRSGGSMLDQEKNLRYVSETRTKQILLNATLETFK